MFQGSTLSGSENTFDGLGLALLGGGDDETMGIPIGGVETYSSGINWNNIINQGFGIGSQLISAFSGQHGGTQIGYNPASQSVFAITPTRSNYDDGPVYASANSPYATLTPQQVAALQQGGVGSTVGSGVDGIFNWLMSNPLITFGGIAALYLLFREPPRRK